VIVVKPRFVVSERGIAIHPPSASTLTVQAASGRMPVAAPAWVNRIMPIVIMTGALSTSWPGLTRPSTSLIGFMIQDVDARDKRGHDEFKHWHNAGIEGFAYVLTTLLTT
jgi:hypothetical protein